MVTSADKNKRVRALDYADREYYEGTLTKISGSGWAIVALDNGMILPYRATDTEVIDERISS